MCFEPFVRYWDIQCSKSQNIYYGGSVWGYGYEPDNRTTEIGARFALSF
ncbi:MAG: hypothetical protein PHT59_03900 [Candidatus Omnitrophica bacterium]|nr:hypothetical protein [Candidatus Omnitrophota bacterium]